MRTEPIFRFVPTKSKICALKLDTQIKKITRPLLDDESHESHHRFHVRTAEQCVRITQATIDRGLEAQGRQILQTKRENAEKFYHGKKISENGLEFDRRKL